MRIIAVLALALICVAPASAKILGEQDAVAVSEVVQQRVKAADISVNMVAELPYAVAYWKAGTGFSAGQALLKKNDGDWTIVSLSNIKFNVLSLQQSGVSKTTAKALVADLKVVGQ
ncbi:MAG TPA: hypothetical protein VN936_02545 [Candidatus Acidoferrum sp.]|jgi:hypothetical protein|nr:hypothetical protein [Candidatus Acidoferrum sp.]